IEHVAVVTEPGAEIQPEDLHLVAEEQPAADANPASLVSTLLNESYHAARDRVITQFERQYLTWLVNRVGGNMSKAARIAGVDRTTLYRLMGRHGLQRSPSTGWVIEREPTEDEAVVPTGGAGRAAARPPRPSVASAASATARPCASARRRTTCSSWPAGAIGSRTGSRARSRSSRCSSRSVTWCSRSPRKRACPCTSSPRGPTGGSATPAH